jgi:GT2 family glycosyltransferase
VIAAVVVTFSASADVLDRCLRALRDAGGIDRVVVVDTGGSAVVAPDLSVEVIRMANRGYGAAANLGFATVAGASLVALLNDDVVVDRGWLRPLLDAAAHAGVGAVQPALTGPDGRTVVSLGVALDRFGAGVDLGDGELLPVERPAAEIEIFTGGAVLFDARFLVATGGFDERWFLYYEDVDLALRGRDLGWRYLVVPASTVRHQRGTSTGDRPEQTRFLQERNRLWTAFRFGSWATILRATWLSGRRLRHQPSRVHRRALVAGLAGAPRRLIERIRAARRSGDSTHPLTQRSPS